MARLYLHVSPGARHNRLERRTDGAYRAYVTARAADGKANQALLRLLSRVLNIPKSTIVIDQGAASRHKVIGIVGLDDDDLRACLESCRLPSSSE